MADLAGLKGQGGGDFARSEQILRDAGFGNFSSGMRDWVQSGAQNYGPGEAQQYGLPMTSGMLQQQRMAAIEPALQSLRASKPEVSKIYETRQGQLEAEKQPLIDRYSNLIADLTGREKKQLGEQGKALSGLYSMRGIDLQSPAYLQDLAGKQGDITQAYGVQRKDVGLGQEADLRDLSNQVTNLSVQKDTALRDVEQQIANLMSGAGNQAINDALQMARENVDRQFQSRFDDLDKQIKQAQISGGGELKFADVLGGGYIYDPRTGSVMNTLRDLRGASGGGGGGATNDPLGLR